MLYRIKNKLFLIKKCCLMTEKNVIALDVMLPVILKNIVAFGASTDLGKMD